MPDSRFFGSLFFLLFVIPIVAAQSLVDEACANLVSEVLNSVDDVCAELEGGNACYVQSPVSYEAQEGADFTFEAPSDIAPLDGFASISTGSFDTESGEWGVVVLAYPQEAPDSQIDDPLDSGMVRYLMVGDVTITDTSEEPGLNPMESFTVSTAAENDCNGAPDSLLMQTPRGVVFDVTVNGAEITMQEETTIVVEAQPNQTMTIIVVTGEASVTAEGTTYVILAGEQTLLILGNESGLIVVSPPTAPIAYDTIIIQFIPVRLLTEVIEIRSAERWTATGITVEAGQTYSIIATEFMKTIDYMPWTGPAGHSSADCAEAGRTDWDCVCRSSAEWGTCTMDETPSMILVGRIGDGSPFVVSSGGTFTADSSGELYLGANDNTFTDNVGAYYVIITTG